MRTLLITLFLFSATSCALRPTKPVKKDPKTRNEKVIDCVDKYIGEGFQKAYDICKDLYIVD